MEKQQVVIDITGKESTSTIINTNNRSNVNTCTGQRRMNYYGVYFAVLPATPTTPVSALIDACYDCTTKSSSSEQQQQQQKNVNVDYNDITTIDASAAVVVSTTTNTTSTASESVWKWLYHRSAQLYHPQLSQPLEFLEISGTVIACNDEQCNEQCQQLINTLLLDDTNTTTTTTNSYSTVVGNVELLLVLPNTPIPILDTDLPKVVPEDSINTDINVDTDTNNDTHTILDRTKEILQKQKQLFEQYGLLSLPSSVEVTTTETTSTNNQIIQRPILDELLHYTLTTFDTLYQAIQAKKTSASSISSSYNNNNNNNNKHHFIEIMQRDENRYDFRLDLDYIVTSTTNTDNVVVPTKNTNSGIDTTLTTTTTTVTTPLYEIVEQNSSWLPLIQEILGPNYKRIKCGCVISLPGAKEQYWHSDGIHYNSNNTTNSVSVSEANDDDDDIVNSAYAICVFVPLLDLTEDTGYTEFWSGSHLFDKLLYKKGNQALPGGTRGLLNYGDCLLYDYRTIHRGMGNTTTNTKRPVIYYLYSRLGYEHVEEQNFTKNSVYDTSLTKKQ